MSHNVSLFEFAQPFSLPLSQSGKRRTWFVSTSYQVRYKAGLFPASWKRTNTTNATH